MVVKLRGQAKDVIIAMMTKAPKYGGDYWKAKDLQEIAGISQTKTWDIRQKIADLCEEAILIEKDKKNRTVQHHAIRLSEADQDIPAVITAIMENGLLPHYQPGKYYYERTKEKFMRWVNEQPHPTPPNTTQPHQGKKGEASKQAVEAVIIGVMAHLLEVSESQVKKIMQNKRQRGRIMSLFYETSKEQAQIEAARATLRAIFMINQEEGRP